MSKTSEILSRIVVRLMRAIILLSFLCLVDMIMTVLGYNTKTASECIVYAAKLTLLMGLLTAFYSVLKDRDWQLIEAELPPIDTVVYAGSYNKSGVFSYGEFVRTCNGTGDDGWLWSRVVSDDEWLEDDDYSYLTHWQHKLQPPKL